MKYSTFGKITALITFLIGTIIFLAYFFTGNSVFFSIGFIFLLISVPVNICILVFIFIKSNKHPEKDIKLLRTGTIMFANIPVMIVYCGLALSLVSMMRITFVNNTGETLTEIEISGCEEESIKQLNPGESKTVWVDINEECAISVSYQNKGMQIEESVSGYLTPGLGGVMRHELGKK